MLQEVTAVNGESNQVDEETAPSTRERIKEEARRQFIRRGIDAVTYGDIAKGVGTTRANLHYHFGSKSSLVSEVFHETFQRVSETFGAIWTRPGITLDERIRLTMEDSRQRHAEFNAESKGHCPWSLSSRARFRNDELSQDITEGIRHMSKEFEDNVAQAVRLAIEAGELRADTPVRDVVLLLTPLWYFGSPITQFAGWRRLEEHYTVLRRTIKTAYGAD